MQRESSVVLCKTELSVQLTHDLTCNKGSYSDDESLFQPITESNMTRSDSKESRHSDDSGNGKTPERSLSPRIPFSKIQTPSFTQLIHPPSVIISDHSHDEPSGDAPCSQTSDDTHTTSDVCESILIVDKPTLERKLSSSSFTSDRSDSIKSYLSDSSYSIDDDDYDFDSHRPKQSVSVSAHFIIKYMHVV